MQINLVGTDNKHPSYNNVDLCINAKTGNIFINWKPDTILKIFDFLKNDHVVSVSPDHIENQNHDEMAQM
jgi:hypothetical protein